MTSSLPGPGPALPVEYLVAERNLSGNTQASYRDTRHLLLPFASASVGHAIDRMTVEDLTPSIVSSIA